VERELEAFLSFLDSSPESTTNRVQWSALASWIRRHSDSVTERLVALREVEEGIPETEATRRKANIEAFKMLKAITAEGYRSATEQERAALLQFTGWGGIQVHSLPADPDIFPQDYVRGIQQYRDAHAAMEAGKPGEVPTSNVFQGLQDQYFTPIALARVMWRLALGALTYTPTRALEPSVGIGRFLRTEPGLGLSWDTCEMDSTLATMFRALYPRASLFIGPFEQAVVGVEAAGGAKWDLIIGNPPYPVRPKRERRMDPAGAAWGSAASYFTARCADLLAPGGVMVMLTTYGVLGGKDDDHLALRTRLMEQCVFSGGFLPPARTFAGAMLGVSVHAWSKLAQPRRIQDVSKFEHEVLAGRFAETEYGKAATMGVWSDKSTKFRQLLVQGPIQPDYRPVAIPLSVNQAEEAGQERAVGESYRSHVNLGSVTNEAAETAEEAARLSYALVMSERVSRYMEVVRTAPESAEEMRQGIVLSLQEYLASHENPHVMLVSKVMRPRIAPLLTAVTPQGDVAASFLTPVGGVARKAKPGLLPRDAVRWYSEDRGVCTDRDLYGYGVPQADQAALIQDDDVCVEPRPGSGMWYYWHTVYTAGRLYDRIDRIEDSLRSEGITEVLRAKMDKQRAMLLARIKPLTISEIDVTPRSGFVPKECLEEWLTEKLSHVTVGYYGGHAVSRRNSWGAREKERAGAFRAVLRVQDSMWSAWWGNGEAWTDEVPDLSDTGRLWLVNLMGYLSRSELVDDVERRKGKRNRRGAGLSLAQRIEVDEELESTFKVWVADNDKWKSVIEQNYNRAFRGVGTRSYDESPISIPRWNQARPLQRHQNSATRWLKDRKTGIIAYDVGAGKTPIALATIALWRQEGLCKKPIILVPNAMLPSWYGEGVLKFLPDYRVEMIGLTATADGPVEDDEAARKRKWQAYMRGEYEVLLVPYSWFLRDVATEPARAMEILSGIYWLRRHIGKDALAQERDVRKIGELRAAAEKIRNKNRYSTYGALESLKEELQKYEEGGRLPSRYYTKTVPSSYGYRYGSSTVQVPEEEAKEAFDKHMNRVLGLIAEVEAKAKVKEDEAAALEKKVSDAGGQASDRLLDQVREDIENKTENALRPSDGTGPVQPLVYWHDLGCDLLVIDELQNFKNLWFPESRYGNHIEFMGNPPDKDTIRAWDLYVKCHALLKANGETGVVGLTGTPIKNSPLEAYNLLSYVSRTVWSDLSIQSPEEFVDRYCGIEHDPDFIGADGEPKEDGALVMVDFKPANKEELASVLRAWVDWRVIDDIPELAAIRPKASGVNVNVSADSAMSKLRNDIIALLEAIRAENEDKADDGDEEAAKMMKSLPLWRLDMLSKIAVDPRLFLLEAKRLTRIAEGKKRVKKEAAEAEADSDTGAGDFGESTGGDDDADAVSKKNKKKAEADREKAERKLGILNRLDLSGVEDAYGVGKGHPPKYIALAEYIAAHPGCGHLIFLDYSEAMPLLRDALVDLGAVTRKDQIAYVTGSDGAEERQRVADLFNGKDRIVDPNTGYVVQPAVESKYRVLIGGDAVSEGMNLQRRTCAIHHLTMRWNPATTAQRNGRAWRQGNELGEVAIRYYVTPRTMDGLKLQITSAKGDWQKSLFDSSSQEVANPARAVKMLREELVADYLVAEGHEDAYREKLVMLREKRAERERARMSEMALRSMMAALDSYEAARYYAKSNPDVATSRVRDGDAKVAFLKKVVPLSIFDGYAALALSRQGKRVFVAVPGVAGWRWGANVSTSSKIGSFYLVVGERVKVVNPPGVAAVGLEKAQEGAAEAEVDVTVLRMSYSTLVVRRMGSPFMEEWTPSSFGPLARREESTSWSDSVDERRIADWFDTQKVPMHKVNDIDPAVLERYGKGRFWQSMVRQASYGELNLSPFTGYDDLRKFEASPPLVLLGQEKSPVVILTQQGHVDTPKKKWLADRIPLFPDEAGWARFLAAIKNDTVLIMRDIDHGVGVKKETMALMGKVANFWFGRQIPMSLIEAVERRG